MINFNLLTIQNRLISIIYDEMLGSIMRIMKKLDLSAVRVTAGNDDLSSDPIAGLKPNRPRDLEILVNLVDFTK